MGKGLMAILAPAKGKGDPMSSEPDADDEGEGPESTGGGADAFAKEAFTALKDDDEAGFVAAFKGAVKACMGKGGY